MNIKKDINWQTPGVLMILAISALVLQVATELPRISDHQNQRIFLTKVVLSIILYIIGIGLVTIIGLFASEKLKLKVYLPQNYPKLNSIFLALAFGGILSIVVLALDLVIFDGVIIEKVKSVGGVWSRLKLVYSVAIGEELFYRFFLMSVIILIIQKLIGESKLVIVLGILISAIIFAIMHFSGDLTQLNLATIIRDFFLGGIAGIMFGWIYFREGLFSAILAHFASDLTIYIIFPILWKSSGLWF